MLCADAKKVTAGIDTKGGDVDMFGHERNGKLTERKERLFNDIEKIDENKNSLNMNPDGETREDIVPQLKTAIERISTRLADTRDLAVKQTFGLNKFKGKIRDMYVISGLQASLYRLGEFSRDALTSIGNLLSYSS